MEIAANCHAFVSFLNEAVLDHQKSWILGLQLVGYISHPFGNRTANVSDKNSTAISV
jgi:hypothetical protein